MKSLSLGRSREEENMVKQIIADAFETLGQTARQSGAQMAQEPGKILETIGQQITPIPFKPAPKPEEGSSTHPHQKKEKEIAKQARLSSLANELQSLRARRKQEKTVLQKQEEKQKVQQLEFQKEEEKKENPVLAAVKQKGGTGERRKMGGGV